MVPNPKPETPAAVVRAIHLVDTAGVVQHPNHPAVLEVADPPHLNNPAVMVAVDHLDRNNPAVLEVADPLHRNNRVVMAVVDHLLHKNQVVMVAVDHLDRNSPAVMEAAVRRHHNSLKAPERVAQQLNNPVDTVAVDHLDRNSPAVMEAAVRHHPNNLKVPERVVHQLNNPVDTVAVDQLRNKPADLPVVVRRINHPVVTAAAPAARVIQPRDSRKVTPTETSQPRIKPKIKALHRPIDALTLIGCGLFSSHLVNKPQRPISIATRSFSLTLYM